LTAPNLRRERQKELISELESEVVQKMEQVELLAEENKLLKLRTRVLEHAVEGREYQVRGGGSRAAVAARWGASCAKGGSGAPPRPLN
jgi:hypothetical protein